MTALLKRPTRKFLVVGTVEPRKGHAQCLAAFEELWAAGKDIDLVVVGKQGWMVDDLAERMRNHAEAGKRLHWFSKASDADLNALYEKCTALLAMSQDEGFGLPLIEAAKHGLPIIARDILVFREIAGEHAAYFSGSRGSDFASALSAWIDRHGRGDVPASAGMPWLTWAGSAERLVDVVLHGEWDAAWVPGQAAEDAVSGGYVRRPGRGKCRRRCSRRRCSRPSGGARHGGGGRVLAPCEAGLMSNFSDGLPPA